jgi:hypothetical protein
MKHTDLLSDYIDRPCLAESWGVSTRTLARYESLPDGLPSLLLGGRRLYHVPTAMGWLEQRLERPNPSRRRRAV